jgi:hypothetical protein
MTLADIEIDANALVKLPLVGIAPEHGAKEDRGARIFVALQSGDALFIERDGFQVAGSRKRGGLNRRRGALALDKRRRVQRNDRVGRL